MILLLLALAGPAHAKDVNVCITLGSALSHFQDEYDQAKFALEHKDEICADAADKAGCEAGIERRATAAAEYLAHAQKNYREAGCEEE